MYQRLINVSSSKHLTANMMSKSFAVRLCSSLVNTNYYDIVIAGGGMVGCAMACKLSKEPALRGTSILLLEGGPHKEYNLDAKQCSSNKSYSNRVSAVSKSSVQLLKSVGAWKIIEETRGCNAVKEMRIWNCGGGKSGGVNNLLTFGDNSDLAYIVENDTILGALYEQIHNEQNITVHYDSRVDQCILPETHRELTIVKLALDKTTTFETSLLIGSDGFGSKVRSAISGQHYVGWEYRQRAVVATLHVQPDENDKYKGHVAWQKFAKLGPVALLPLDNETCSLVWTTSFEEAQRLLKMSDDEFIATLNGVLSEEKESNDSSLLLADDAVQIVSKTLSKFCSPNKKNDEPNLTKSVLPKVTSVFQGSRASFPLGFGHACKYVGQRVALVGDAAHRIHPLAGQGVNLGFNDVTELSNQLKKSVLTGADIGDMIALLKYETAAQRCNVPIMLGVDGIQKIYGSNNKFVPPAITTFVRNMGLAFCQSATIIKKLLSNKASGLPV